MAVTPTMNDTQKLEHVLSLLNIARALLVTTGDTSNHPTEEYIIDRVDAIACMLGCTLVQPASIEPVHVEEE